MISSRYPVLETDYFLEVSISSIEPDPESKFDDKRCQWKVTAPDYEKTDYCYGIDEFQCVYLAFDCLKRAIKEFEETTEKKCEYHFFPDVSQFEK